MVPVPHVESCSKRKGSWRRRAGAVGAALGGLAMVSSGAFASWQATATANTGALTAASATVAMVDANGGTFSSAVSNLLPGDYFYRYVNLSNDGTATAPYSGTLGATGDLGPQLTASADACSVPWTSPGGVSTCTGTTTALLAATSIATPAAVTYGPITSTLHVRYSFTFSTAAPATLQGKAGTITATVSTALVGGRNRTGT